METRYINAFVNNLVTTVNELTIAKIQALSEASFLKELVAEKDGMITHLQEQLNTRTSPEEVTSLKQRNDELSLKASHIDTFTEQIKRMKEEIRGLQEENTRLQEELKNKVVAVPSVKKRKKLLVENVPSEKELYTDLENEF